MKLVFGDRDASELAGLVSTPEGLAKAKEYLTQPTWCWPKWLTRLTDEQIYTAITDAEKTARPEV
jgi:hypothetical protein